MEGKISQGKKQLHGEEVALFCRKGPGTFERVKKTRLVALCWLMKSMACDDAGETERGPTVDYVRDVRLYLRSQRKLL